MIQRVQTIYLLLAFAACIFCMCSPVGHYTIAEGMDGSADLFNLWVRFSDGSMSMSVWGLFAILSVTAFFSFLGIFQYKRRMMQMRICTLCILLLTGWYITYAVFAFVAVSDSAFRVDWHASLPMIAIIFLFLAFRGIRKDEKLVRSLDRLR